MSDGVIKILICDDHPVVRAGLRGMLSAEESFEVVGEAEGGEEAVELTRRLSPNVVLMDLRMPGMDGAEATSRIKQNNAKTRILILTTYDSDADILKAIKNGATGYLLKDTPKGELFEAIRMTAEEKTSLSPNVATRLVGRMREPAEALLSNREIETLELVAQGASNREIAEQLWISETTVKSHMLNIFEKLGVADRTAAVTVAIKRGLISV